MKKEIHRFIRQEETKVSLEKGSDYDYTFDPYNIEDYLLNLEEFKKADANLRQMLRRSGRMIRPEV